MLIHHPSTFIPLNGDWIMTALNPQAAPEGLRDRLTDGVPARVPGEATMDLLRAGLIGDPFDGDNEQAQQWIGDVDWRFTCRFDWHDDGSQRHDLVAYGLDTVAALELNGRPVGGTQNSYRSYRWDVRDLLQDGENTLTVSFTSPVREGERRQGILGYYPHDSHPFNQLRKAASSFGWDWGIDVANAGIWQPIGIDSWSGVRIAQVRPLVDVTDEGEGLLTVDVDLERAGGRGRSGIDETAAAGGRSGEIPVRVRLSGNDVDIEAVSRLRAGADTVRLVLKVPDVKLWWPLGYGDHPLYRVDVEAGQGCGGEDVTRPQATWSGRVGFRTVSVDTAADEDGRPFRLSVNGVPVHARGYNWIPDDAFITRMDHARYQRRIQDLVESNSNMVRVWGGGYYESDDFYDLADENGIMVWQDFMFACAAYPEDPGNKSEIEAEAREQIGRLSPHPSLVVWNGSNENYTAYADWGGFKNALADPSAEPNEYGYGERPWGDGYYSDLFPRLFAKLDPTRVYLPSSPMSFTKYTSPNKDNDGTVHIWDVWNSKDYKAYRNYRPRFADEFGYQAPPAWSTLTRVVHDS
ncbi:glycoside hydrolase family 2 protein, partial [Bifidobacterium favimelis]